VEALFQAASEPKQLQWYESGHALDCRACQARFEWMRGRLNLEPLAAADMKEPGRFKLKQMVQPL